jgi:histidine decarboxylase
MSIEGLSHGQIQNRLDRLHDRFRERKGLMVGYQWSQSLEGQSSTLGRFLDFHLDNIGDPFSPSLTALSTKEFEREVLDYFAALWHARTPATLADRESYWGYVLSMGSTEGNLFALTNARDYLSGRPLLAEATTAPRKRVGEEPPVTPVLFFSDDAHYSFAKAAVMLRIDTFQSLGDRLFPGQ